MKKINIKIAMLLILIISLMLIMQTKIYAANASISCDTEINENESITISVHGSGVQWNLKLIVDGEVIAENSEMENYEENININFSGTYNPSTSGTKTIKLEGSVTDVDGSTITDFASKNLTVNNPAPTPDPDPTPEPEPEKDPTFTDTNKTMYTTGAINLRESWSTSSKAVQVDKDTEVTVTGTSTDKVNGYVWFRINYNGQTKYVASNLLTETAPESEEEKSNNTNLKTLIVEGFSLTPSFNKDKTSYTLDIAKDVTKLNIKAEPEDEKSTVTVQGNENLKDGENVIAITVNAEDGSTKIYEIKANRKDIVLGLKNLKVEGTDIEKNFKTDKYEYKIDIKELSKLNIVAVASDADAKVEITGNEDLKVGENIINIKVTSKDGTQTANYKIIVNKLGVEEENETVKLDKELIIYIIIGATLLIALIVVVIYTVKHRHQEDDEYEYDEDDNYEAYKNIKKVDNYEEIDDDEEQLEEKDNLANEDETKNNEVKRTDEDFYERLKEIQNKYRKNNFEDENDEIENKTKELKEQLEEKDNQTVEEDYEEDLEETEQIEEPEEYDIMKQDRETRLKYFLDNRDDYEEDRKPRRKKGKHF